MKKLFATLLLIVSSFSLFAATNVIVNPQDVGAPPPVEDTPIPFSVSPFAAYRLNGLSENHSQFGAGVDVGFDINKFVSLHLSALGYSDDNWGGSAVDEGSIFVKANLARFQNESLILYAIGSGDRDFSKHDWGFGAGLGAQLNLTKNISVGVDGRLRAWFEQEKDFLVRGLLNISIP